MLQIGQLTDVMQKDRPTLGYIIPGTKCDRDTIIFCAERGENKIKLSIAPGLNGSANATNGVNRGQVPYHL